MTIEVHGRRGALAGALGQVIDAGWDALMLEAETNKNPTTTDMLKLNAKMGEITFQTNIATGIVKEGNEDDKETARLK